MAEGHGGTAGRERDSKPQMVKGLVLVCPGALPEPSTGQCWAVGPTGPSVGCIVGWRGSRRLWVRTRGAAYQLRAGLQSDFGNPDELSII